MELSWQLLQPDDEDEEGEEGGETLEDQGYGETRTLLSPAWKAVMLRLRHRRSRDCSSGQGWHDRHWCCDCDSG